MLHRGIHFLTAALAACIACGSAAGPQDYPARPVRVVVPFAAGGTFDLVARLTAQKLSEAWAQQVVVENRAGGGTIMATETVAKASPDGYTLLLSPNAIAANPALHSKLPYNAERDLAAVVLLASQPMAIGAHLSFVASGIQELIAHARARPRSLAYGTAGAASGGHLAGEIFKAAAGIDLVHVSYKGGNLAMMDVIANQIPLVVTGLPNLLPQMKAGRLKILGITEASRSPAAPSIPTIGETVPGYAFRNWFGILAPARTSAGVVRKINAEANQALNAPDVRDRLADLGFVVIGGTPEAFAKLIREDTRTFGEVIRRAGIKVD